VDDEVSVAELLEREGRRPHAPAHKGRTRVVAVMLAVVLGCGLAALLVHFGSQHPDADSTPFTLPHSPTGGLAGGGVPAGPDQTEVTSGNTSLVVTNESAPGADGFPWHTRQHETNTQTMTVTESGKPRTETSREPSVTTTESSHPGGAAPRPSNSSGTPAPTPSHCLLFLCL
jgi:hypothetical protein